MPQMEEKHQKKNGGFIRLMIVAMISMVIGAGGGILIYREFESDQNSNCEITVNGDQNPGGASAQELMTSTMSADLVESFYEDLEKQREAEKDQIGVNIVQTIGIIPPPIALKTVDYTQLACGFDTYICMWQDAKRWMHTHGDPNSTVPKGGYLRYSQFDEINGIAVLTSPIVNNTENSYCFLVQYQILGGADLRLYLDNDFVVSLLRNSSDSSGLWHLERVNITNFRHGFQLFLAVDDRSPDNVTVSIDYTDLRSGPCDSSMMVEDVPNYLSDIRAPGLSGALGGNLHPDGEDQSASHSSDDVPLPFIIGVPEPSTFGIEDDGGLPATGLIVPDSLLPDLGSEDIAQPPSHLTKPVVDDGAGDIPAIASLPAVESFGENLQPVGENLALTLPPHSGDEDSLMPKFEREEIGKPPSHLTESVVDDGPTTL